MQQVVINNLNIQAKQPHFQMDIGHIFHQISPQLNSLETKSGEKDHKHKQEVKMDAVKV